MAKRFLVAVPLVLLVGAIVAVFPRHRSNEAGSAAEPPPTPHRSAVAPSFDWQKIAAGMQEPNPGGRIPDESVHGQFLRSIDQMDEQVLIATWESLQSANLASIERQQLEFLLMGALIRKNPEAALNRFAKHAGDTRDPIGVQLFGGFRSWAARSPSKAALWLDQNVAAGNFSERHGASASGSADVRLSYERELVRAMIELGQSQAAIRLESLAPTLRGDVLKGMDPTQGQSSYAVLIRRYLPPREQEEEFIRMARSASYRGGKPGVAALLDIIQASPGERERILRRTEDFGPGGGR